MKSKIAVIAGDGIGPEVVEQGLRVLLRVAQKFGHEFSLNAAPFGGAAIDLTGDPLPKQTLDACLAADAVLLGAIGGPKWGPSSPVRPEQGLLRIRRELGVYANLRPIKLHPACAGSVSVVSASKVRSCLRIRMLLQGEGQMRCFRREECSLWASHEWLQVQSKRRRTSRSKTRR